MILSIYRLILGIHEFTSRGFVSFRTYVKSIEKIQVLDPIDGTRGFLKASKALYVVSHNENTV